MNLEQLYKERFEHFEAEPSANAMLGMQQKLRYAKKIALLKWIVGSAFVLATTITVLSFYTDWWPQSMFNDHHNIKIEQPTDVQTNSAVVTDSTASLAQLETKEDKQTTIDKQTSVEAFDNKDNAINNTINNNNQTKNIQSAKQYNVSTDKVDTPYNKDNTLGSDNAQYIDSNAESNTAKNTSIVAASKPITEYANSRYDIDRIPQKTLRLEHSNTLVPPTRLGKLNIDMKQRFASAKTKNRIRFGKTTSLSLSDNAMQERDHRFGAWNAYFDVHWSPFLWRNSARITPPDLDETYTYNLPHKSLLSYEIGASLQLHHQDVPVFLQLGADYQWLRESIDYSILHAMEDSTQSYWQYDSVLDINTILDTFCIIVDSNHFVIDSVFVQDTTIIYTDSTYMPFMVYNENAKVYTNTYRYLNIPLLLGYQFHTNNRKWSFQVLGGVAIGINLHNKGWYYTQAGTYRRYAGKVKPSLSWHFCAATNVNYKWKQWLLFVQPEFQYQWHESGFDKQVPPRKYQFYKLKLGIRRKLF